MIPPIRHDSERPSRIGISEAVLCAGKSPEQIVAAAVAARSAHGRCLLTRLAADIVALLPAEMVEEMDYEPLSHTAILGGWPAIRNAGTIAVVTAGTADVPVAFEAMRTLRFEGVEAELVTDVGVAGLWRLLNIRERLADYPIVILIAGMEGALFSVAGGLLPGLLIAVPTSVGYGVGQGGTVALNSALSSCAPGILATNIDNGYGAACAALRALRTTELLRGQIQAPQEAR